MSSEQSVRRVSGDRLSRTVFKAGIDHLTEALGIVVDTSQVESWKRRMVAYWQILRDLPDEAFTWGVKTVAARHRYPTLPTPGEIRAAAVEFLMSDRPTELEAWKYAEKWLRTYRRYGTSQDPELRKRFQKTFDDQCGPRVKNLIERIGWDELRNERWLFFKLWGEQREQERERLMRPAGFDQAHALFITSQTGKALSDGEAKYDGVRGQISGRPADSL